MPRTREENLAAVVASNERRKKLGLVRRIRWELPEDKEKLDKYHANLLGARGIRPDGRRNDCSHRKPDKIESIDALLAPFRKKMDKLDNKWAAEERAARKAMKTKK